jgi:hypothetical protein
MATVQCTDAEFPHLTQFLANLRLTPAARQARNDATMAAIVAAMPTDQRDAWMAEKVRRDGLTLDERRAEDLLKQMADPAIAAVVANSANILRPVSVVPSALTPAVKS